MILGLFVSARAILIDASIASDPEFQKKKESSEGWGMMGNSFSISLR